MSLSDFTQQHLSSDYEIQIVRLVVIMEDYFFWLF